MKKEVIIFFAILLVLTFVQHTDIFTAPMDRIKALPTSGAYGLGAFHPLVFTFAGYIALWVVRGIIKGILKFFEK
jgi:hypothetical protein